MSRPTELQFRDPREISDTIYTPDVSDSLKPPPPFKVKLDPKCALLSCR